MKKAARRLRVVTTDAGGRRVSVPGLATWLARVAPARLRGVVTVALVTDGQMRALNRRHRGRDYPTDVLAFPDSRIQASGSGLQGSGSGLQASGFRLLATDFVDGGFGPKPAACSPEPELGDIAIARGVARRQARAEGHSELTELRMLALHGLLHLIGYDHHTDDGAMGRLEHRLRRKGGV